MKEAGHMTHNSICIKSPNQVKVIYAKRSQNNGYLGGEIGSDEKGQKRGGGPSGAFIGNLLGFCFCFSRAAPMAYGSSQARN